VRLSSFESSGLMSRCMQVDIAMPEAYIHFVDCLVWVTLQKTMNVKNTKRRTGTSGIYEQARASYWKWNSPCTAFAMLSSNLHSFGGDHNDGGSSVAYIAQCCWIPNAHGRFHCQILMPGYTGVALSNVNGVGSYFQRNWL
jgi:hypothetical protein